ncbi:hypothetical protein [Candidatus Uabimicrobium amorphum]|uniref:Uncharacterized protein n=1 Tax=Uabimicrobium amorphum TaxID=2596890 RepID=A0A5S9F705_UABAM|nr:hypothetical protein [Candidatus Uabimicrobium amorphum]BBM87871.1 hypothetical protein UABAM_06286 [Candidatus Uabimicrobium amorphum]
MKNLCIALLLIVALHADFAIDKIFSVSYERGQITVHNNTDVATGIDNFYVSGDDLYLLHSSEQRILHYSLSQQEYIKSIDIPAFAIDIAVQGQVIFVVTSDQKLHIINSRQISSHSVGKDVISGIHIVNNMPVLHLANGSTLDPSQDGRTVKGWQYGNTHVYTEKVAQNMGKVVVHHNDLEMTFDIPTELELGSIVPLGVHGDKVFVRIENLISSSPIQVSQQILCLNIRNRGHVIATTIPNIHNNFSYNDCKQIGNTLFKMMLTPQGIDIITLSTEKDGATAWPYDYAHHYNDHLSQIAEPVTDEVVEEPKTRISRSQIIWNAEAYLGVYWSCKSKNTTGLKTLPDGSKIRTPKWVKSGSHYKIPYKWGGFTSVSVFKQKASQGKYAGSDYTKSVSWGDNHCVGVDCSGFVSRAWGTSKKYGTSTIGQVSTQLSSTSKLKKGDALNKRGSHIVLVIENNPSGTVSVIEASGIDWAVSKRTRNLSSMSGYKPIYYNNVSEWK